MDGLDGDVAGRVDEDGWAGVGVGFGDGLEGGGHGGFGGDVAGVGCDVGGGRGAECAGEDAGYAR